MTSPRKRPRLVGSLLLSAALGATARPVRAEVAPGGGAPAPTPVAPSLMAPASPLSRGRVALDARPYFNLLGPGWGTVGGLTVEYQPWQVPLKLSAGLSPVAMTIDGRANRAILHARVGAAFTSRFLELGVGVGSRVRNFGPGGYSLAAGLRMGALDGLSMRVDLTYLIIRNYYTGERVFAFSNLLTAIEVPLHPAVALIVEGGVSLDAWLFLTIGIKHHLGPRGAPGTWAVRGGLGIVWTNDECLYMDPRGCEESTWSAGPTLTVGVERRF